MYKTLLLAESMCCVRWSLCGSSPTYRPLPPCTYRKREGEAKKPCICCYSVFWWHGSSFTIDYEGSSPPFPGQHAHTHTHNSIIVMTSAVPTAFDHQQVKPERKGPFNSLDDDSALLAFSNSIFFLLQRNSKHFLSCLLEATTAKIFTKRKGKK